MYIGNLILGNTNVRPWYRASVFGGLGGRAWLYHTFGYLLQPFDAAMQVFMANMEAWWEAIKAAKQQGGLTHAANNRRFPDAWRAGRDLARAHGPPPRACTTAEYQTEYVAFVSGFG
jgi:hypothetical protein